MQPVDPVRVVPCSRTGKRGESLSSAPLQALPCLGCRHPSGRSLSTGAKKANPQKGFVSACSLSRGELRPGSVGVVAGLLVRPAREAYCLRGGRHNRRNRSGWKLRASRGRGSKGHGWCRAVRQLKCSELPARANHMTRQRERCLNEHVFSTLATRCGSSRPDAGTTMRSARMARSGRRPPITFLAHDGTSSPPS